MRLFFRSPDASKRALLIKQAAGLSGLVVWVWTPQGCPFCLSTFLKTMNESMLSALGALLLIGGATHHAPTLLKKLKPSPLRDGLLRLSQYVSKTILYIAASIFLIYVVAGLVNSGNGMVGIFAELIARSWPILKYVLGIGAACLLLVKFSTGFGESLTEEIADRVIRKLDERERLGR